MSLRFGELFAGAGGLSLGLERAGWECAWHAEIAEQPRAILAHRWPNVPLLGDVTTLDGLTLVAQHGPIDLLSGGSPCQDLSVAGKRAGLAGARSGLFYEQMRLWKETGADLCLWENVDGARSSNQGKDFGEVLRAFVGAAVLVPSDGWRSAGVAAGPAGVAAWRVLDAQYFGVPQRRRRVFVLGTRTGRVDPAEVLSLAEGVPWDSPTGREAREGSAEGVDGGVTEASGLTFGFQEIGKRTGKSTNFSQHGCGITDANDPMYTLQAGAQHGVLAIDFAQVTNKDNRSQPQPLSPTLNGHGDVIAFTQDSSPVVMRELSPSLKVGTGLDLGQPPAIVAFNETGHEKWTEEQIAGSLNAHEAREAHTIVTDQGNARAVVAPPIVPGDHAGSYNGMDAVAVAVAVMDAEIANTLNGTQRQQVDGAMTSTAGIPRRLTPLECERLQAWPDGHTLVPDAKGKLLSDAARYKAIGNGCAAVHGQWIGWRLALALGGGNG